MVFNRLDFMLASASVMALSSVSIPAMAQGGGASTGSGDTATNPYPGEIVVTAQRREETLQDVPLSVIALGSEQLEALNIRSIDNIQLATPGFVINGGYTYAQTYIRGVGTDLPNSGLEAAVAIYVDGAYQPRAVGSVFDMVDAASVQVLKGPQGTLYGRNATGGAILIATADPTTDKISMKATAEYGRFDHVMGEAAINVPLSDTVAVRFAGRYSDEDGYIKNLHDGSRLAQRRVFDIRGKMKFEPNEDFNAVLTLEHMYQRDGTGQALQQRFGYPLCGICATPGWPAAPTGFYEINSDQNNPTRTKSNIANLRMHYDAGPISFDTTTVYTHFRNITPGIDQDYTPADLFNYGLDVKTKHFQQDLLVTSNYEGPLNFMAGATYFSDTGPETARLTGGLFSALVGLFGDWPISRNRVSTKSYSAFLEAYFKPVDRLTFTVGGRYTRDKRKLSVVNNLSASIALAGGGAMQFEQSDSFNSFTPRIVVAYDLDDVNLYASYNKGFKAGGYATPAFAPTNTVEPEKIESFEVGAKYVSPDRRFRLNLAAFLYNYSDLQRSVVGPGGIFTYQNAAKARGKGIEFDGTARLADWFDLTAAAAYLHTKYTSFPGAAISIPNPVPPGGLSPSFTDLTGEPLSRAPKWTFSVIPSFHFDVGGGWKARMSAVGRYTSAYDFAPGRGGPLGYHYQPSMFLANASAAIVSPNDRYEIGAYVNNLTDRKYWVQRTDTQAAFGIVDTVAAPITYGVRLTVRLD